MRKPNRATRRAAETATLIRAVKAAFAALGRQGILCRANYTCCQTCGMREVLDEIYSENPACAGYAFWHEQDHDLMRECGELYLSYGGSGTGAGKDTVEVGRDVAAALRQAGLSVTWDGTVEMRICVRLPAPG